VNEPSDAERKLCWRQGIFLNFGAYSLGRTMHTTPNTKPDEGFAKVPNLVLDSKVLKANDKLVLCGLIRRDYRQDGIVWPSRVGLSKDLGLDRGTVSSSLGRLEQLGIAEEISRDGRGQVKYQLHLDRLPTWGNGTQVPAGISPGDLLVYPHQEDRIKQTYQDKTARDVTSAIDSNVEPEQSDNGNELQTALRNGPGDIPAGLQSRSEIHKRRLAPDGTPYDDCDENVYTVAKDAVTVAGGEPFNPKRLGELVDAFGEARVWFQARWFLRRLGALKEPPKKVTPYFIKCVVEDFAVNPNWPKKWHEMDDDEILEDLFG
jgi:hypothetical protein